MFTNIQRFIVVAAIAFAALTISDTGYTKGKGCASLPPKKALQCDNCQTHCYDVYQKKILGPGVKPGVVGEWKKEYTQCNKSCVAK
jgi:hypothetical protein